MERQVGRGEGVERGKASRVPPVLSILAPPAKQPPSHSPRTFGGGGGGGGGLIKPLSSIFLPLAQANQY